LTFSKQDIISDNNGCLDFVSQCENNPIFDGITNSDTCNNGWKWAEGKYEGKIVADTCKKSCGKCGGNCKDDDNRCPGWANNNWCTTHSQPSAKNHANNAVKCNCK